ncbi:ProQ/FINO family protein [Comamonas sp. 17RB]|uniref:ProQ/FINO family protein n=1 Tax=Comamonas sp. 17RB TaxID=3047025 RepID=UPI0024B7F0AF|nr:ProQ/FINO family protein [Comamonas sp. 17RB]MDI9856542.1 ProQ/FINO family protein [Comamonas sp. 17RB]
MTETVSSLPETPASDAAAAQPAQADGARRRNRRGGRGRAAAAKGAAPQSAAAPARPVREIHPVLLQLAQLYPALFGDSPKPLKRGIFQDLQVAQGEALDKDGLKQALALHTRSTRYLNVVATGAARCDLQGVEVEAMAPEHVLHALIEVFRRKKPRDGEDLQAKLQRRIGQAFIDSGLGRDAYLEKVQLREPSALAKVEAALAVVAEQDAKAEAVLRAFEGSGAETVDAFADMYGMNTQQVQRQLHRARQLKAQA